jgi:hypothetical protein
MDADEYPVRRAVALLIIAALVAYGVVRVGVGAVLLAQAISLIDVADYAAAVAEVGTFLGERADRALVLISVPAYCVYILAMGALLVGGGAGVLWRRRWGFALLGLYLVMHAALFVNYQEVNPKLFGLALSVALAVGLAWLRPPERPIALGA